MNNPKYLAALRCLACSFFLSLPLAALSASQTPEELPDSLDIFSELDEVTVSVKKEIVNSDGAKLTYDLDQDQSSRGLSLLDALRKVPMVSVDGDDNIYIKGQSNFKIYVNGREEPMLTANAKTILKAMPAESVARIEVINEPGAKYDAEGVGGILNLITERKQSQKGSAGSLSLSANNRMTSASAYARAKQGRITADAGLDYSASIPGANYNRNHVSSVSKVSDSDWKQTIDMRQRFNFGYLGAKMNLSWDISDKDLLTFGANLNDMSGKLRQLDISTNMLSRDGSLRYSSFQRGGGKMKNFGTRANASYQRTLDDAGQNITAAYAFNFSRNGLDLNYENSSFPIPMLPGFERNSSFNYVREHTATLDYTNPFKTQKHTLEAGAKAILRHNSADSHRLTGPFGNSLLPVDDNLTRQIQNIYAAYALYTGAFGPTTLTGGLRYEHTYMGIDFLRGDPAPDFRRNLNDWVPNAAISYKFDPVTSIRLAYQMRISRPSVNQINPYKYQMTATFWQQGNPYLTSERYNNLTLTFSKFARILGGSIALDASQSNNTIEEFTYWENSIQIRTNGNFGHKRKIGLNGYIFWNPSQKMSFNLSGNVAYSHLKSKSLRISNHAWDATYNASWSYTGPLDIKYSLYGGQNTGDISLQGRWNGWHYYGLSISRAFLRNKNLTVAINAQNFFESSAKFTSSQETETHFTSSVNRNRNWSVGATVSWTFGNLKDRVKSTDASIDNDDTKSSSKSSSGGGGISM